MISVLRRIFGFHTCIRCQLFLLAILIGGLISGCAQVRVHKIPTPTQYANWSDEDQKKADSVEGFRFYLPRPFVNVFESFPVHADVHIVEGVVSPDGKYVVVRVPENSKLAQLLGAVGLDDKIQAREIGPPQLKLKAVPESRGQAKPIVEEKPSDEEPKEKEPPTEPPTGIDERAVTNDNNAYAYQPMRGNMDIVYMPDFDEQYAVSSEANLGNVKFQINLGQGWSLQGFNSRSDNSAINRRVFKLLDDAQALASQAAPTLLGLPPLPAGATDLVKPQSGAIDTLASIPGTRVSLKVTVVYYAAKGLYPVIKPRELQAAKAGTGRFDLPPGGQGGFFMNIATGNAGEVSSVAQGAQPRATIPVYPYQYISFNTFQFLALELVRPDTDPFDALYDKTGTAGDPGDRQRGDLADFIISRTDKGTGDVQPASADPVLPGSAEDAAQRIAKALNHEDVKGEFIESEEPAARFIVRSAVAKGRKVEVEVEFDGLRPAELSDDRIRELLAQKAEGVDKDLKKDFGDYSKGLIIKAASNGDTTGQSGVVASPPQTAQIQNPVVVGLNRAEIRALQTALCLQGTEVDGIWGKNTAAALTRYQKRNNLAQADGELNVTLRDKLLKLDGLTVNTQCRTVWAPAGQMLPHDPIAAALHPGQVRWIQSALCLKGRQVDGLWEPKIQGSLRRWQLANSVTPADGLLTAVQRDDFLKLTGAQIAGTCP